mmetsp:Transcript_85092/g.124482  ORF Transcript_85092/g.124482 Transcript_85092/m.124482 type:complete len:149 (+) Transcript_85092:22-468(+)
MSIGPDVGDYRPSDDEGKVYHQGFIHYHVGEIAQHMEKMTIGPDASDYVPSDDGNQKSVRSNGKAMCNRAEGQNSDENYASKHHSEYITADECGWNERSIESCNSDSSGRSAFIQSCNSDTSGRSECNIVSFSRDDSIECRWPLCVNV